MVDVANPYSAPTAVVADADTDAEAESVRRTHIATETSLRAVGLLYFLGALGAGFAGFASLHAEAPLGIAAVGLGAATAMAAVGYGLRALKPWVRIPAILLAALGLLGFPIGTLINGYVLYLLLCAKGRFVFTPDYAQIRNVTPHVRYRSSLLVRILFVVLLVGLAAAILIPAMSF